MEELLPMPIESAERLGEEKEAGPGYHFVSVSTVQPPLTSPHDGGLMKDEAIPVPALADEWERSVWGKIFLFSSRSLRGGGFVHSCECRKGEERTTCLSARKLSRRQVEALPSFQSFIAQRT